MSHGATKASQHPANRFSWISLPNGDNFDNVGFVEGATQHERRLQSPSPILKPHIAVSPQVQDESSSLLSPHRSENVHNSIPSTEDDCSPSKAAPGAVVYNPTPFNSEPTEHTMPAKWQPYTLRAPFLILLATVSLALAILLSVLLLFSARNHGLGKDDGSVRLLIAWRYTPTIMAVLFTLAIVILNEDVKRTEAFARMASPLPVAADFTLFYIPKAWWRTVLEGFSQRRSGGRKGWILAFSSLAAGISILIISTFSSSVLTSKEVLLQDTIQMQRYTPGQDNAITLVPRRNTYTQTISGFLYNASTSTWVSDSYVILPFGLFTNPDRVGPLPDGVVEVETKVMQMESSCTTMVMNEKMPVDQLRCQNDCSLDPRWFKLRSEDGCEVKMNTPIFRAKAGIQGFSIGEDMMEKQGGILWTNISSSYVSWQDLIQEYGPNPPKEAIGERDTEQWSRPFIYSASDQCHGRDLLLVTPPWYSSSIPVAIPSVLEWQKAYWQNFTVRAELCTPAYYEASTPVIVTTTNGVSRALFNPSVFAARREPIPQTMLDREHLNDLSFRGLWNKYTSLPADQELDSEDFGEDQVFLGYEGIEGVPMLLGSTYAFNLTNMMENSTLGPAASRLRSRFFGEVVLSSVMEADSPVFQASTGQMTLTAQRILIVPEVAITLAISFLLAACYALGLLWCISTGQRPLQLRTDPSTTVGLISLLNAQSTLAVHIRSFKQGKYGSIRKRMGSSQYALRAGAIIEIEQGNTRSEAHPAESPTTESRGWISSITHRNTNPKIRRPGMLRMRWLVLLLLSLISLATTLLVLRKFAMEDRLYHTAFIYQIDFSFFNTSFSPHSLIATIIAVTIGLFWDGLDKPMRKLQPYLSMSKRPTATERGVSLSYEISYWIWAAAKAARRKHWILCLVTIGTTLTQIFISMAAIFERKSVVHTQTAQDLHASFYRPFIARQTPIPFYWSGMRPFYLHESILDVTHADWMYTALDELTLKNGPPTWTKDEWVFLPVDLTGLPNKTVSQKTGTLSESEQKSALVTSQTNVSLITSALRSRLECSVIQVPVSGWLDPAQEVWSNRSNETVNGYVLPAMLFDNMPYNTPVFSVPKRMACCTNGTDPGGQSVIAYWSSNSSITEKKPEQAVDPNGPINLKEPRLWSQNFTIKWIVGPTSSKIVSGRNYDTDISNAWGLANETLLYFTEEPHMSMLNCIPVIETVNASLVLRKDSSQVLEVEMLEQPQPAPGAWDYAWDVVYPKPTSNDTKGNVSFGTLFTTQLLVAADIIKPKVASSWLVYNGSLEDVLNERFAIRDTDKGLNMDFMSYANYYLANKDPTALLNPGKLLQHSQRTFQTFFKHFAVSGTTRLGTGIERNAVYDEFRNPYTKMEDEVTLSERIEILTMNETATWLSLAVIFLLIFILVVVIIAMQTVYPRILMPHRIECLTDVLLMVVGSDELLNMVHERGVEGMAKSNVKTRLGWLRDKRGVARWGIEVVDGDVEWLDHPEEYDDSDHVAVRRTGKFASWARFWKKF